MEYVQAHSSRGEALKSLRALWRVPGRVICVTDRLETVGAQSQRLGIRRATTGLRDAGHSVIVFEPHPQSRPEHLDWTDGTGVRYVHLHLSNAQDDDLSNQAARGDNVIEAGLRVFKPSAIVALSPWTNGLAILRKARSLRLPFVYQLELPLGAEEGIVQRESEVARLADRICVDSTATKSRLQAAGVDPAKLYVDGIDAECWNLLEVIRPISLTRSLIRSVFAHPLPLSAASVELPYFFENGTTYRLAGRLVNLPVAADKPAVLQFEFDEIPDPATFAKSVGLSHSSQIGFFRYLLPASPDGSFELRFAIPEAPALRKVGIRTWQAKAPLVLDGPAEIEVLDRARTTCHVDLIRLRHILDTHGVAGAQQFILSENIGDRVLQADQLEMLFDLAAESGLSDRPAVLHAAYQLDPTFGRGKRLALGASSRGMLTVPAAIYESLLQNHLCSPTERRQMKRVISLERIRRHPIKIPEPSLRPAYEPNHKVSLMFVYSCLPYQSNGYATRTHGICRALTACGRRFIVYSRPGYPFDILSIKKTHAIAEYDEVDGVGYRHLMGADLHAREIDDFIEAAANIVEAVARTNRASVLHAASNYINALPVLLAARRLGIPFIYEVRGLWEVTRQTAVKFDWAATDAYELDARYESLVAASADRVLPITGGLADELVQRGVDRRKMVIVPNGVNLEDFATQPPDVLLAKRLGLQAAPTIGFVGSFVDYEGLDDLLAAAQRLKQSGRRFNVLLVGDGQEFERLKKLTIEFDLADKVFLTGRVPHHEVPAYYSLIDIAPFPRKPLKVCEMVSPLKPFEAMAMGKTVLVSNVAAMTEFIRDGDNGFAFQKGSVEDLARQLAMLLDNPAHMRSVGERARAWVAENRTWPRTARIIEQEHDSLASTLC